jgi:hypothetical protein
MMFDVTINSDYGCEAHLSSTKGKMPIKIWRWTYSEAYSESGSAWRASSLVLSQLNHGTQSIVSSKKLARRKGREQGSSGQVFCACPAKYMAKSPSTS